MPTRNSFGFLKIYERDESLGEEHGAERFAVLFFGGDAIALYDAIFGNTNAKPFAPNHLFVWCWTWPCH